MLADPGSYIRKRFIHTRPTCRRRSSRQAIRSQDTGITAMIRPVSTPTYHSAGFPGERCRPNRSEHLEPSYLGSAHSGHAGQTVRDHHPSPMGSDKLHLNLDIVLCDRQQSRFCVHQIQMSPRAVREVPAAAICGHQRVSRDGVPEPHLRCSLRVV